VARREEGRSECARGEREYGEALFEAIPGFSGEQARGDDLCVAGGAKGVGGTAGIEAVSSLRYLYPSPILAIYTPNIYGLMGKVGSDILPVASPLMSTTRLSFGEVNVPRNTAT
jgi:hypothetical protein